MTREEAIEVYNGLINIKIKEAFEFFAPELKVSEDERVIEMLRIAVQHTVWLDEDKNRCYRWLEKQGEKKPILDIEIPFGAKDSELQEASYYIPEGFHAEIEGNRVVIKRGEQKPVEWIQELEDKLANATPKQLAEWKEKYFKEEPAEWSEEDEEILKELTKFIPYHLTAHSYNQYYNWAISHRPQPHWKPSDEQMEYLAKAILTLGNEGDGKTASILNELRTNLKKLREE